MNDGPKKRQKKRTNPVAIELGLVEPVAVGVKGADLAGGRVAGEVNVAAAALPLAPGEPHVSAEPPRREAETRREYKCREGLRAFSGCGCAGVLVKVESNPFFQDSSQA